MMFVRKTSPEAENHGKSEEKIMKSLPKGKIWQLKSSKASSRSALRALGRAWRASGWADGCGRMGVGGWADGWEDAS